MNKGSYNLSAVSCKLKIKSHWLKTTNFEFSIAILMFIALVFLGCVKQEIKNINSAGKNIVCFGDSVTFGYGVEEKDSYPAQLARMLNKPVINSGIDGNTSSDALNRIEEDVLSKDPYLVVVEFGGNDFLTKIPIKDTESNVRQIIDKILAKGSMVALADVSAGFVLSEYRPVYAKIAREKGVVLIPGLLKGIITNPKMKSDFFHPNPQGYKLIAYRILRQIKPYIKN
ncbi:MAG: GDSL-type esterase/lipase family protein [Candidatus Omnitrophica bacterium]|jgi:acyl-CoA thioesterase-1|nr:GDSL-type esterase/lipase family protein [Candidatus Omnitrophota bacterium]